MSPLSRLLKIGAIALALLMIVLVALMTGVSVLLGTNVGSAWLLEKLLAQVQSETRTVSIERSLGTLLSGLDIDALHYRDESLDLRIDSVRARWNPMTILSGDIRLDQVTANGVAVQWLGNGSDAPTETGSDPFAGILPLPWPVSIGSLNVTTAHITWPDGSYDIDSVSLGARLLARELQVDNLRYVAGPVATQGTLNVQLQTAIPLQGQLQWQYTGPLVAEFENAAGELTANGDLNTLHVAHRLDQPVQLSSEGDLDLHLLSAESSPIGFRLVHSLPAQLLQASSLVEDRQLRVTSASVNTDGNFDFINVGGEARVSVEQSNGEAIAPPLTLRWQTALQADSLRIDALSVDTDSGHADASGLLQWQAGTALSLHLNLRENNGEQYAALLPEGLIIGALQGEADVSWQQDDAGERTDVRILALTGELNEYPLSASGALSYGDGILNIDNLQASSGSTELALNGRWEDSVDLHWRLQAADLSTLSPLFSGSIAADGRIQGTPETPQISLSATGQDIDLAGVKLTGLSATGAYVDNSNQFQLTLDGVDFGDNSSERIDSLSLNASGLPVSHDLHVVITSPRGDADLTLDGSLHYDNPVPWTGTLRNGVIVSDLGEWRLEGASTLQLGPLSAQLARQCWLQGPSTLCLEGTWQQEGSLRANASLENYPLDQFNAPTPGTVTSDAAALLPQLPVGSRATGSVNASASVEGDPTRPDTLALQFQVNAGEGRIDVESVTALNDAGESDSAAETQSIYWRSATLEGSRSNGAWQVGSSLDFYQPDLESSGRAVHGTADAQINIGADESLDGQINLAFQDLSWIEAFAPVLENPTGQLRGLSVLSGTLDAPRFGGSINLTDGAVDIPAAGIKLQDISVALTSDNDQTLVIQGRASSGDGSLRFVSEITTPVSPERQIDMTLTGQDFMLANNDQIRLTISPDLQVKGSASALDLRGNLTLPVLDVQINTLPESAVDVSPDTVVVNNSATGAPVRNAAQADRGILDALALTAELRIALGDEVRFRGFGLDARLNGALDITQRSTGSPLTYGELTVLEGNYQTYGRTLNIEHGKLLFFGAMDNPALDIRAVRQAEDVKVGVQMNGTLRNIRSQLFSTPTLPDGDIIAVMLTGRPLAEVGNQDSNALMGAITSLGINQGQSLTNQIRNQLGLDTLAISSTGNTSNSSLTLGKYLTPKLFIRYGVGLFETESTLAVDYSVSDRIKLEAKSGSTQSVDIKYTVER